MQMGFNNECDYRDLRFHIQTEDRGIQAAKIESHIFHSGNILDTSVVSYEKIISADLEEKERDAKIISMMKANHRLLYQRLIQGEYDRYVGLTPQEGKDEKKVVEADLSDDFSPGQERVSDKVRRIEEGELEPIDVAAQTPGTESVNLSSLREKLERSSPTAPTLNLRAQPKIATPPPSKKPFSVPRVENESVLDYPDTGVKAYRGLVHKEKTLNVTELLMQFL